MTLLVLGVAVGLVLGLTGAGGSMLAVPLLTVVAGWSIHDAGPASLLTVCLTAALGTAIAWRRADVRYRAALLMGACGILAAPLGVAVAAALPGTALSLIFSATTAWVALRLWRQAGRAPLEAGVVRAAVAGDATDAARPLCRLDPVTGRLRWTPRCGAALAATGTVAGFAAGLLGVGGGFVVVPGLRATTELSMTSAVATSLMVIAITTGAALATHLAMGSALPPAAAAFAAGGFAGMLAGQWLAPRVAGPQLQRGFAALLIAVAASLAFQALRP